VKGLIHSTRNTRFVPPRLENRNRSYRLALVGVLKKTYIGQCEGAKSTRERLGAIMITLSMLSTAETTLFITRIRKYVDHCHHIKPFLVIPWSRRITLILTDPEIPILELEAKLFFTSKMGKKHTYHTICCCPYYFGQETHLKTHYGYRRPAKEEARGISSPWRAGLNHSYRRAPFHQTSE
jgi:hypothetical protein